MLTAKTVKIGFIGYGNMAGSLRSYSAEYTGLHL